MRQVSEKTLEINICAELLDLIRQEPGCEKAWLYGLTQRQEGQLGFDECVAGVPCGFFEVYQFKAPWPSRLGQIPYRFTINERQQECLLWLAKKFPDSVLYVFPFYNQLSKVSEDSPELLTDTWFARVIDVGILRDRNSGRHRVDCYDNGTAIINSESKEIKLYNQRQLKLDYRDMQGRRSIGSNELKQWLRKVLRDERKYRWMTRGLHIVVLD